ncbi:hypothetical protein ACLOJK_038234 [Asimina triloba]
MDVWSSSAEHDAAAAAPLQIFFTAPSKYWTDAAPIGNGRLGAMVWGAVHSEKLQLNDDTLWTGIPGDYTNPEAPSLLPEVRELVDRGQYAEATAASYNLLGNPSEVYQPLGDVNLEIGNPDAVYDAETYERVLDLETATVKVKYTMGDVQFMREHFASHPHQVIVTRLSSSVLGSLSFTVSLDSQLHHNSYVSDMNRIVMEGSCPGKRIPPKTNLNEDPKGIQFSAVLELQISGDAGTIQILDSKKLKVQGSNWAILLLTASSSFDGPFTKPSDSKKDPTLASLDILNSIKDLSYSDLYSHHLDDFQKLFHRFSLQLSKSSVGACGEESIASSGTHAKSLEACQSLVEMNGSHRQVKIMPSSSSWLEGNSRNVVSTAERVKSFKDDEDPSLLVLLFQFGRYLLISCSRPGTQPANLQGIWNKDTEPAWNCAPHLNINLQMNYWPSLPCNLRECQEPLFEYISSLAINGTKTAHCIWGTARTGPYVLGQGVDYEASGWVAHHCSDIWAKTSPHGGDPKYSDFLEDKAYPLLEGCALFLLDWLVDGHGGYLITNPSTSPEHQFIAPDGKLASVSYASTMDMAIIREIFSAVISAAEVLGRTSDALVEKVKKAEPRLLPTRISREVGAQYDCSDSRFSYARYTMPIGICIKTQTTHDYPAQDFEDPEVHHRHLSHLFGIFPGHTITPEKNPDLCKAAANSLFKRESAATINDIGSASTLRDTDVMRACKLLFGGAYVPNFCAVKSAIAEILVQSTQNDVYLLPALPRDKWASGFVKGLKARGGVTVNMVWKEGKLHEAGLWVENQNSPRRLHYNGTTMLVKFTAGLVYTFNGELKCLSKCSL